MADVVADIKSRLSIVDVVGQYVQLKKAGLNYKGLCPFHSEKTPSFVVSPEKQICHCFGCSKGGDIFTFIQEVDGVTFPEALQILADRAGVKIDDISKFTKNEGKSEKDEYYKAHNLACEFFEKELWKSNDGKKVIEYLKKRGLTDDTIREFRIGFAPDKFDALHPYLLKKGISKRVLLKSGLISAKGVGDDRVYDKYRSRLIFPIFDYLGRVCGFGGRALKADQMPKYLNSPENVIYSKSRVLYGLSHAKQAIKEAGNVVIVEGYFDVIVPYQSGVKNVVASSGTALTADQARLLKRLTGEAVTCFDNDSAGFEATKRGYSVLRKEGVAVKTIPSLGTAKDPADLIVKENGDFGEIVGDAKDFFTYFVDKLVAEHDVSVIDGRRAVIADLLPFFKEMKPSNRDFYVRDTATKLKMDETALYDEIENFKLPLNHPARSSVDNSVSADRYSAEKLFVSILINHPSLFCNFSDVLENEDFSEDLQSVYKGLCDQYNSSRQDFVEWDEKSGLFAERKAELDVWKLYVDDKYGEFSEEAIADELKKLVDKIRLDRRIGRLKTLEVMIEEAEKADDKKRLFELLKQQQELLNK